MCGEASNTTHTKVVGWARAARDEALIENAGTSGWLHDMHKGGG
jgi:hypothetical protein